MSKLFEGEEEGKHEEALTWYADAHKVLHLEQNSPMRQYQYLAGNKPGSYGGHQGGSEQMVALTMNMAATPWAV